MRTKAGMLWGRQPVAYGAVIRLGMLLLTSFGINITDTQQIAILAFTEAVLMLVTNSYVQPNTPRPTKVSKPPRSRTLIAPVLLALALTSVACAPRNVAPELVAAEDAVHDALASAHDGVEAVCRPGQFAQTCAKLHAVMAQVLRAGRAFSVSVQSERVGGLSALVEEIGRALAEIRALPDSDTRARILADLRQAIDHAFRGAQTP